eukprot:659676-Hanusia_phi.AAC.1
MAARAAPIEFLVWHAFSPCEREGEEWESKKEERNVEERKAESVRGGGSVESRRRAGAGGRRAGAVNRARDVQRGVKKGAGKVLTSSFSSLIELYASRLPSRCLRRFCLNLVSMALSCIKTRALGEK